MMAAPDAPSASAWPTGMACGRTLKGHEDGVSCVAVRQGRGGGDDSLLLASCSDTTIRVWDAGTGACIAKLVGHTVRSGAFTWVWCVAFHPQFTALLASGGGGRDRTIKVWDYVKKKCIHNLIGHDDQVSCVSFHPTDVELLLSGSNDQTVAVWNFPRSTLLFKLQGHTHFVNCIAIHPTNPDCVASGASMDSGKAGQLLKVWDVGKRECVLSLKGHGTNVYSVQFSPHDPSLLVSSSADQTVKVWDHASGTVRRWRCAVKMGRR